MVTELPPQHASRPGYGMKLSTVLFQYEVQLFSFSDANYTNIDCPAVQHFALSERILHLANGFNLASCSINWYKLICIS